MKPNIIIKEMYCVIENRTLPSENFHQSKNPHHTAGFVPICKDCANRMVYEKIKKTGNLESAMWLTCAELGVPFLREVYTHTENQAKGTVSSKKGNYKYMNTYMTTLKRVWKKKEWSFDDTDVPLGEIKTLREKEELIEEQMNEFRLLWGDYDVDDIGFLEWRYDSYTSGKPLTEYQASRYRDLCICELRINKDSTDKDALAMKSKIAAELGENQFKIDKEKSLAEQTIENQIYMMEKNEPAEFYTDSEMYKDFFNIGSYWRDYVLRPVKNLVTGSKDYNVKENTLGDGVL